MEYLNLVNLDNYLISRDNDSPWRDNTACRSDAKCGGIFAGDESELCRNSNYFYGINQNLLLMLLNVTLYYVIINENESIIFFLNI